MGRMVRYVIKSGRSAGQSRPALVVRDWSENGNGCCNLQVFLDGSNDKGAEGASEVYPPPEHVVVSVDGTSVSGYVPMMVWLTSIDYAESKAPGTWHWPTLIK
jgi:hypothetical protein